MLAICSFSAEPIAISGVGFNVSKDGYLIWSIVGRGGLVGEKLVQKTLSLGLLNLKGSSNCIHVKP